MPHITGFDVIKETAGLNYDIILLLPIINLLLKHLKYRLSTTCSNPSTLPNPGCSGKARKKRIEQPGREIKTLLSNPHPYPASTSKLHFLQGKGCTGGTFRNHPMKADSNYTHIFLSNGKKITTAKQPKRCRRKPKGLSFTAYTKATSWICTTFRRL